MIRNGALRRVAFTAVELLIVITIIAVLMAILIPAIGLSLTKVGEMRARQDLGQLDNAAQAFMNAFGVNYIPSRIRLCSLQSTYTSSPSGFSTLDADSQQYLLKLFPKLGSTGSAWASGGAGVNWTSHPFYSIASGGSGAGVNPGDEILEGHQCLVFFLGGIQLTSPGSPTPPATVFPAGQLFTGTCTGFSTNPANPSDTTATVSRVGPYFDFQPSQLTYVAHYSNGATATDSANRSLSSLFRDQGFTGGWAGTPYGTTATWPPGSTAATRYASNAIFLSYLDTYHQQPYAYFSGYKGLNQYNHYSAAVGVAGPTLIQDNATLLASVPSTIQPPASPGTPTPTGGSLSVQPYANALNPMPTPGVTASPTALPSGFYKPDRYQILCAGADGKWGLPETIAPGGVVTAPFGYWLPNGSNCTGAGQDDMTNFATGKLMYGQ